MSLLRVNVVTASVICKNFGKSVSVEYWSCVIAPPSSLFEKLNITSFVVEFVINSKSCSSHLPWNLIVPAPVGTCVGKADNPVVITFIIMLDNSVIRAVTPDSVVLLLSITWLDALKLVWAEFVKIKLLIIFLISVW